MIETIHASLESVEQVRAEIASGASLFLAGSHAALRQLPHGQWIAGTIPYFMSNEGGLLDESRIFVTRMPAFTVTSRIATYDAGTLSDLYNEAPDHGVTFLILPASSAVHRLFAERASLCEGFLLKPVTGWVAGVRVDRIGVDKPNVVDGQTGSFLDSSAVALHVTLPDNLAADLDIVNIFQAGSGDLIEFDEVSFRVSTCRINGQPANLADYIASHSIPRELPLVGDYNGSAINVAQQKIDTGERAVHFYAPVFPGVHYRFARPVADYEAAFAAAIGSGAEAPAFACNCILNYVHGHLEGKKTGSITGPITFGEIAHQLLNQTMVRLYLRDIS